MQNQGDKNITSYLASEIQEAITDGQDPKNVTIRYDVSVFPLIDQRRALRELAKEEIIKIIKDYDSYLYEQYENEHFAINPKALEKNTYTIPAGVTINILNEKKLKAKAKILIPNNISGGLIKNYKTGEFFINGKKVNIGSGTDHYFILDLFCSMANEHGIVTKKAAIQFLNDKKIKVGGEKINESNIYKKISNALTSLYRFASVNNNKLSSELPSGKQFIKPMKEGKNVIGWQINI